MAEKHPESLTSVLGRLICSEEKEVQDVLDEIATVIAQEKGVGKAVKVILTDGTFQDFVQSMAVPDGSS